MAPSTYRSVSPAVSAAADEQTHDLVSHQGSFSSHTSAYHTSSGRERDSSEIELSRMSRTTFGADRSLHPGPAPLANSHSYRSDLQHEQSSHHTLLPDYQSFEHKPEPQSNITEVESAVHRQAHLWQPGLLQNLPWTVLLALLGVLICVSLYIIVLVLSDGAIQGSWRVEPTVSLAILAPLSNIMLQYGLSQGVVVGWWSLALRGTDVNTLHHRWAHGTSVLAAAASGRRFDKLAAAKMLVATAFAVNPLLQRASKTVGIVVQKNATVPFQLATNQASFSAVNFTSAATDGFSDPVQLTSVMVAVMRDYTNRAAIQNPFGNCTGNCTGTVRAAGIVANCSSAINNNFTIKWDNGGGSNMAVFGAGTNVMNYQTGTNFTLSTSWVQTTARTDGVSEYGSQLGGAGTVLPTELQDCDGTSWNKTCSLQHAVLEYPILMTGSTITILTGSGDLRTISTEPNGEVGGEPDSERVFTGLSIAANSITSSSSSIEAAGPHGWSFYTAGPLTSFYLQSREVNTCQMDFTDPTEDILSSLNEIMFRISLAAFNSSALSSSKSTNYTLSRQVAEIHYESHYAYLVAATVISLVACASLLPTFDKFWTLGRPMSLSPIEVAKAFNAPVLQSHAPGASNMPVQRLLSVVGSAQVQYGVSSEEYSTGQDRLQMASPGLVERPTTGQKMGE